MAENNKYKGTIGILTGGGDVPGLNPAIRAVTIRALREGYNVIGIRRGWAGLVNLIRDHKADNSENFHALGRGNCPPGRPDGGHLPAHFAHQSDEDEFGRSPGTI